MVLFSIKYIQYLIFCLLLFFLLLIIIAEPISLAAQEQEAENLLEEGKKDCMEARFEDAIAKLSQAVKLLKDEDKLIDGYLNLAISHFALSEMDKAKEALAQLILLQPQYELNPYYYPPDFIKMHKEVKEELKSSNKLPEEKPAEHLAELVSSSAPESVRQAKNIMLKAVETVGGFNLFKNLNSVNVNYDSTIKIPTGEMQFDAKCFIVYPDKYRVEINTPIGQFTTVRIGEQAWMETPQGIRDIPVKDAKKNRLRDFIQIIKSLEDKTVTFQYVGEEDFQGKKAHSISVFDQGGDKLRLYVDISSYKILGMKYKEKIHNNPPDDVQYTYSDFREVGGINYPFRQTLLHKGEQIMTTIISKMIINPKIDPVIFQKKQN